MSIRLVGYASHQDPPHIIFTISEDHKDEVLRVAEASEADLRDSDIYVDDNMVSEIRDIIDEWITDIDIRDNDWFLE